MNYSDRQLIAQQVVEIIPGIMRQVGAGIHCSGTRMATAHFRLLTQLARNPCNLSELAGKQRVTLATMSNSIETLVERGWVNRSQSIQDRRQIQVQLTPAGKEVLVEFHKQLNQRFANLLEDMTDAELSQIREGLKLLSLKLNAPNVETNCNETEHPYKDASFVS